MTLKSRGQEGTHSSCSEYAFGFENSFYVDAEGLQSPACLANLVIDSIIRLNSVAGISRTLAVSSRLYLAVFAPSPANWSSGSAAYRPPSGKG